MLQQSRFLRMEACPKCRKNGGDTSGDNLGVYTNGSYCFSCGYKSSKLILDFRETKEQTRNIRKMPECGGNMCAEAYDWLDSMYFTDDELNSMLYWSDEVYGLVFPITENFYQIRNYRLPKQNLSLQDLFLYYKNIKEPASKWINKGKKPVNFVLKREPKETSSFLIVVEDYLSAKACSKIADTLCLFGTSIKPTEETIRLMKKYHKVIFFLDSDKEEVNLKYAKQFSQYGINSFAVEWCNYADPKYFAPEEFTEFLSELLTMEQNTYTEPSGDSFQHDVW
jgi:hypothetical protein